MDRKSSKKAKVFIVDDYPEMRESLRKLLDYEQDFQVCGEANDVDQAMTGILSLSPDVVILDLVLGRQTGLELLAQLHRKAPQIPILILSMLPEGLNAELLLEKGAKGYLMKTESPDQILEALRRVLAGKIYLSPAMEKRLGAQKGKDKHE